jgi:hypothetical protein
MTSAIDPTKPEDGVPASKRDLRANLVAAKAEIEALQAELGNKLNAAFRLSAPSSVDLNSTDEQELAIDLGGATTPTFAKMIKVDSIQDDPAVDTSAVRWAAGYPVYDEAGSTETHARVLIKSAAAAGVPATGRARIFFEF